MLDISHIPQNNNSDIQIFTGNSNTYGESWQTWIKPRGKSMCSILLLGRGGNGGTSTPGLVTAIAGAGGGSAGALVYQIIPISILPDRLYLSIATPSLNAAVSSCVAIAPSIVANDIISMARGGNSGLDWTELTTKQLRLWGAMYDELRTGKPSFDVFIDDKAFNSHLFFN